MLNSIIKVAKAFRKDAQEAKDVKALSSVLAALRAASHLHQTHHWQTHSSQYYGDHLLFERLYNDGQANIDALAEKAVGVGQSIEYVNGATQIAAMTELINSAYASQKGDTPDDMVRRSISIENSVLESINGALESLEGSGNITAGVRSLLEDIADGREGFLYLLQQRANGQS